MRSTSKMGTVGEVKKVIELWYFSCFYIGKIHFQKKFPSIFASYFGNNELTQYNNIIYCLITNNE